MFLIFYLEYLKRLQSSEPLHAKRPIILLLARIGLHRILSSYWLAHFHLMKKIRQSSPLFWFGLRNDEIFYLRAAIQRTIDGFPAFMEYGLAKKITA